MQVHQILREAECVLVAGERLGVAGKRGLHRHNGQ
jgi:hypothetical protein